MAAEPAGNEDNLPGLIAPRAKLRLRTGLAIQLLVLIGVGLLLLGTFVVRQTGHDLVRQVDNTLQSSLRGRLRDNQGNSEGNNQVSGQRDNQGVDQTTAQPGPAPQKNAGTNPTPQEPPSNALLGATPADLNNPINPINPINPGVDGSGNHPPRPEDSLNQDLPPSATITFDAANQQLQALGSGSNGIADPLPKLDPGSLRDRVGEFSTVSAVDGSIRFRVLPAALGDGIVLVEAAPLRLVDAAVADLIRTLIIGSLVVMGLAGIALYLLLRRALQPLAQIATAAGVVATGHTGHGVAVKTRYRELDQLSQSLDTMVAKLGGALEGQGKALQTQELATNRLRAFVSDASHELQTPVTSIRGWAELHRRGGLADQVAVGTAMSRIENEAARMGRLVDDLLVLARADEQQTLVKKPVDLELICTDAVEAARAIAPDRSVTFTAVADQTHVVEGDPDQLRQILDNLLANVRSHTPIGTKTSVHIESMKTNVVVKVSDNGPGFDPEHLDHAFDRFWRADQTNRKSHGLGLAIVQAIATAHGGTVTAKNGTSSADGSHDSHDSHDSHGATISLELPQFLATAKL
jgi:two-component system, OmpR family, sensor kinase